MKENSYSIEILSTHGFVVPPALVFSTKLTSFEAMLAKYIMILKLQALLNKKTLNAQVAQLNLFIF